MRTAPDLAPLHHAFLPITLGALPDTWIPWSTCATDGPALLQGLYGAERHAVLNNGILTCAQACSSSS